MAKQKKTLKNNKKTEVSKKKKQNKSRPKSLLRSLFKWTFVLAIWVGIAVAILVAWYAAELPQITSNADFTRKATVTVQDSRGNVIARYGDITGTTVKITDLPPHLPQAVLAIEDRRFYRHFGIDPIGITRALVSNITGKSTQGGSTITQQLAKNLFLTRERTLKRKIQEALLAFWLESQLSKDEILSSYLNRVYFGSGTYGVDAASKLYFDKPASEVNLLESAILAGLLKAPSRYSPHNNPELSQRRAKTVLQSMVHSGFVSQEDASNAGSITISENLTQPLSVNRGRYFTDWIVSQLDDLIGTTEEDLIVKTTLNTAIQRQAEDTIAGIIEKYEEDRHVTQGAALIMRPNGAVIAMVGGKNYSESQFNRVTQAQRQPGSSFKPFTYLTALEQGWKIDDLILDEEFERKYRYRPKNYGHKYYGEVTLTESITHSMNTAAVRLMKEVGTGNVIKTAQRLGIESPLEPDLSLALGSSSTSLLEMTNAYAHFANGGLSVKPYAITKITAKDGELYYSRPAHKAAKRVIEQEYAQDLSTMLKSVTENGTGRGALMPGTPMAGKTGTSQDSRDGWFIGYTGSLVAGVWLGNDDNTPMKNVTGGNLPANIWRTIAQRSNNSYGIVNSSILSGEYESSLVEKSEGFSTMLGRFLSSGKKKNTTSNFNLNE